MPSHCISGQVVTPQSGEFQFTVKFNSDVSEVMNFPEDKVSSSTQLSRVLCDSQRVHKDKIPSSLAYSEYTTEYLDEKSNIDQAVGIATSGAFIHNALDDR